MKRAILYLCALAVAGCPGADPATADVTADVSDTADGDHDDTSAAIDTADATIPVDTADAAQTETTDTADATTAADATDTADAGCDSPYVYLKDRQLWLGDAPYVPVSVNYIFDIRRDPNDDYFIATHGGFCTTPGWCCNDRETCLAAAREHLAQIKAMGFNSVRIVGLAVIPQDGTVVLDCGQQWPEWVDYCAPGARLVMWPPDPRGLALIADAVALVKEAGLKGILLAGHHAVDADGVRDAYASYLEALAAHFADEPTLFAYDLTNEPVYEFAQRDIDKVAANAIGRLWYDAVRAGSPRHMVTMGLAEIGTVRHWDPGALPLDFTSFHIYGSGQWTDADRDYLATFLAWAGREPYPWLVGEVGLSIEDGGPSETAQQAFAQHVLDTAWACGSMGLQWWLYRDVHWGPPGEHYGLVRWDGTARPAAAPFAAFHAVTPRPPCVAPDYWGSAPEATVHTIGRLVREDGTPVPNGFVRGQRCFTGGSDWTISGADGTFDLRSTSLISELEVTASGLSLEKVAVVCNLATPGDITLKALPLSMEISPPSACPP